MKILVVLTGGTIGSSYNNGVINVNTDSTLPIINEYSKIHNNEVCFESVAPINILSENISKSDFESLYIALMAINFSEYDGIILTCGSDTLAYISSFIGLLFSDKNIAIVATNRMLSLEGTNGFDNFEMAVDVLKRKDNMVVVPWKNSNGTMNVYDATTLLPCDFKDDVYAFGNRQELKCKFSSVPLLINDILMITPYPLLSYQQFNLDKVKAVLHLTYHSATANMKELIEFKKRCDEKEIPIYLCGIKNNQKIYASTKKLIDVGIVPLYDIAYPCAYIKLLLAVNQNKLTIEECLS